MGGGHGGSGTNGRAASLDLAFLVPDEEIAAFLARGAEDRDAEKRRTLVLRVPEGLLEPDPRVMAARTLMAQQLVRAFGMQWSDVRAFYVRSLPTRKVGGWATTAAATKAGQAEHGPGAAGAFALDETCTVPFA